MQHARGIILQLHSNAVRLIHHVAVGDNVAFGGDNHARTERALADCASAGATRTALATLSTTLPAEKTVEEIIERTAIIVIRTAATPLGGLYC